MPLVRPPRFEKVPPTVAPSTMIDSLAPSAKLFAPKVNVSLSKVELLLSTRDVLEMSFRIAAGAFPSVNVKA